VAMTQSHSSRSSIGWTRIVELLGMIHLIYQIKGDVSTTILDSAQGTPLRHGFARRGLRPHPNRVLSINCQIRLWENFNHGVNRENKE
jgi:hypothetical protein